MPVSRFEVLVKEATDRLGSAALELPLGDSHKLAELKGRAIGLRQSLELYKQTMRIEDEDQL